LGNRVLRAICPEQVFRGVSQQNPLMDSWDLALTAENTSPTTISSYLRCARLYVEWCEGNGHPLKITRAEVQTYTAELIRDGKSPHGATTTGIAAGLLPLACCRRRVDRGPTDRTQTARDSRQSRGRGHARRLTDRCPQLGSADAGISCHRTHCWAGLPQ
jgi:hypothetical protein